MVEPHSSSFRVITTNFWVSEYLGNLRYITGKEYRNDPKISDTRKFAVITFNVEQDGVSLE